MKDGNTIILGNYDWQVIKKKDGKLLVITKEIIEVQWYHNSFVDTT